MLNLDNLPAELLPFKENILATVKPVIDIKLSPADELPLWASKVGGKPYLPLDVDYPFSSDNNPLKLLAQFNLADLPKNDQLPPNGMLSFFISGFDDNYGRDFDNPQNQTGFRVLYFDKVIFDKTQIWQDFSDIEEKINTFEDFCFPFEKTMQFAVNFELTYKEISEKDYQFEDKLFDGKSFWDEILNDDVDKYCEIVEVNEWFTANGHHLLGYPHFIHEDIRDYDNEFADYILLFQLDSSDNDDICWGDCGLANFLIHPNDLKNKDFSRVYYDWACS